MMLRTSLPVLFYIFLSPCMAQEDIRFRSPVDFPIYLSGNFGEIRTDHFHSGIDIKTQGSTGHRVYAAEAGYVSRIKVQANGYGKSIYISHPNGYTSVYGHLDRYRDDIAAYVRKMQYQRKSHTLDLYLDKSAFIVDKGDLIAYSGNTGSSSGPHLHFEIRSTADQHPTNVLSYNLNIRDQTAPRFFSLYLYPMDGNSTINGKVERFSSRLVRDKGIYTMPYGTSLTGSGTLGISVEVFDFLDGVSNRCGIYSLEMFVDNKPSYRHVMDEFSFSETRYVNAHTDYEEGISSGTRAHRLHRLPNDRLRIYDRKLENRALQISEDREYQIRILATDVAGNSSAVEFTLQGSTHADILPGSDKSESYPMRYQEANTFTEGPVQVDIPAYALYQDLNFSFSSSPPAHGSLTPFYHIATSQVPLQLPYTLAVQSPDIDPALYKNLLFISTNDRQEVEAAGGAYQDGKVLARLNKFGAFAVALDTIAPLILRRGYQGKDFTARKDIRFTIRDELSGIERYEGYIDNKWVLFEYDPKNELLVYEFDQERLSKDMEHELELYISDEKGNVSLYQTTFLW